MEPPVEEPEPAEKSILPPTEVPEPEDKDIVPPVVPTPETIEISPLCPAVALPDDKIRLPEFTSESPVVREKLPD